MDFTGMRWTRIICHFIFVGFYPGWAIHSSMLLCRSIFFLLNSEHLVGSILCERVDLSRSF